MESNLADEQDDVALLTVLCESMPEGVEHQKAFTNLYERYWTDIVRFLALKTNQSGEAEDLAQKVFIKFYQKRAMIYQKKMENDKAEQVFNVRAYLYRMANNVFLDEVRAAPKLELVDTSDDHKVNALSNHEDESERPEELIMATELDKTRQRWLQESLQRLSEKQQRVIELRLAGISFKEIAEIMSISEPTVKEYRKIALTRMQEWYSERFANQ